MPQINIFDELIVDYFAGGGGASTGMEKATGRPVDIAINHDPDAILTAQKNLHRNTLIPQRQQQTPYVFQALQLLLGM